MLLFKRRAFLFSALAIGGCGFEPVYKAGSKPRSALGKFSIPVIESEEGFAFRSHLQNLIGKAEANAPYALDIDLNITVDDIAVTAEDITTRYIIKGETKYKVKDQNNAVVYSNRVIAVTSHPATGGPYATRVAEKKGRDRVAYQMAEQIAAQLAAQSDTFPL